MPGRGEIAQRVVQSLEAAGEAVALLPAAVAGGVLVALGVTAAEHESLGRQLAAEFRAGMVTAAEATVTRALVGLGLE